MRTEKLAREDPLSPFASEYVPSNICTPQLPTTMPASGLDGSFLAMDGSQYLTPAAAPPDYYSLIAPPPQTYNPDAAFYYSLPGYPQVQFVQATAQITPQQQMSYMAGQQFQAPPPPPQAPYVTAPPQPPMGPPPATSSATSLPTVVEIEA